MKNKILEINLFCFCMALASGYSYCENENQDTQNSHQGSSETLFNPGGFMKDEKVTTFKDAVAAAMKNSAHYAMSKIENVTARLNRTNAYAVIAPNIEVTATTTKTQENTTTSYNETDEDTGTLNIAGVITQNIFHGFRTMNNFKSKDAASIAAKWKLESDTATLLYSVAESLTNLWYAHEDYRSAKMKMDNLAKELQAQKSSFAAGATTKYDVAKAKANHEQAIYEADLAKLNIVSTAAEFTRLTGLIPTNNIELPKFDKNLIPHNQHDLESIALKQNPGILQAKFAEQSANYDLKVARGQLAPKVDLVARCNLTNTARDNKLYFQRARGTSVSLQMTIPILSSNESSGNTFCLISIANEAAKRASYQVKDNMNTIKKECFVSFNNYKSSISMINAAESAVISAKVGADGDRQESALGLKSNTETLVRENQIYDSRKSLARSRAQLVLAEAAMLRLMGKLNIQLLGL